MRLTIATICITLLLTAGLCAYSSHALGAAVEELQAMTDELGRVSDAGDTEGCIRASQAMLARWEQLHPQLATLSPHEQLESVLISLTGICQKARIGETRTLVADIAVLGAHVEHLLHSTEPGWHNLL